MGVLSTVSAGSAGHCWGDGCSEDRPSYRGDAKEGQPSPGAGGLGGAAGEWEVGRAVVEAGVPAGVARDPGGAVAVLREI